MVPGFCKRVLVLTEYSLTPFRLGQGLVDSYMDRRLLQSFTVENE